MAFILGDGNLVFVRVCLISFLLNTALYINGIPAAIDLPLRVGGEPVGESPHQIVHPAIEIDTEP